MKKHVLTLMTLASVMTPAIAQNDPVAGNGLGGPPVAGVCMLGREAVLANAAAGKSINNQMQTLVQNAQSELAAERSALERDARSLEEKRASLGAEAYGKQSAALQSRAQLLQQKTAERSRQLEAARGRALQSLSSQAQPVIAAVYSAHHCGLLIDRSVVLGGNAANDLTVEVVQKLDQQVKSIQVQR